MSADAVGGLVIVVLFTGVLAAPALAAYRGRYRSWTYRGVGTRYGAFAVGWVAAGLLGVVAGGVLRQSAETLGLTVGAVGLLLVVAGLGFFVWMPPALVPRWRRELLKNSKLYRAGNPDARMRADVLAMDHGHDVVVWQRSAPVASSEWHALSVGGLHVRPRLRLPGRLRGPLPDRHTGVVTGTVAEVEGELLVDGDLAAFVQAPAEDARHHDNWFAVLHSPADTGGSAVTAGDDGTVVRLGTVPGHGALDLLVPQDPDQVRRRLARGTRPRRMRQTVDGRFSRVERTTTT
ncbi:hypothetical protein CLV30_10988 [Haloactinopolyspora alba]|uniref:Uncharacterized protein n=1 Tax=Haloactinopolyspora alba TaxID=648780 RepID=A0A2P8DZY3_9ACTN|nr:hypothetical protein [Haloactinopolyspora alba]PSL02781.1 hypothetical protein CLV30_10988 [Haloactinopolyspora alba]